MKQPHMTVTDIMMRLPDALVIKIRNFNSHHCGMWWHERDHVWVDDGFAKTIFLPYNPEELLDLLRAVVITNGARVGGFQLLIENGCKMSCHLTDEGKSLHSFGVDMHHAALLLLAQAWDKDFNADESPSVLGDSEVETLHRDRR